METLFSEYTLTNPPPSWEPLFLDRETNWNLKRIEHLIGDGTTYNYAPRRSEVFNVFYLCPINMIRVVILGQDPYHSQSCVRGETIPTANGLAFSTREGDHTIPPSLNNIFKVMESTVEGFKRPKTGDLTPWVKRGVFLLNTSLTVEYHSAGSHKSKWDHFILSAIIGILTIRPNTVFLLWGEHAIKFMQNQIIKPYLSRAIILTTSHPSPFSFSRGFNKSNHFNEVNQYLDSINEYPIDWSL